MADKGRTGKLTEGFRGNLNKVQPPADLQRGFSGKTVSGPPNTGKPGGGATGGGKSGGSGQSKGSSK